MKTTFKEFLEMKQSISKTLYILRGVPGSGKSYKAKELAGSTGVIFSTDEFWGSDSEEYLNNFKQATEDGNLEQKQSEYHGKNYERAVVALKQGVSPIVIDNTNVEKIHFQHYVDAAKAHGYQVQYAESDFQPWKDIRPHISSKNPEELEKASKFFHQNNKHGVPQSVILKMLHQFEDLP
jgi:predicted kinase